MVVGCHRVGETIDVDGTVTHVGGFPEQESNDTIRRISKAMGLE